MREIPLNLGLVALVDDEDYERLEHRPWYARRSDSHRENWYVQHTARKQIYYLHREVIGAPAGAVVDHINGNGLDNRRCNLRLCSLAENAANRDFPPSKTGFRGVSGKHRRFRAHISVDGRSRYLGSFPTAEEAARAFDRAARDRHGDFARLNFPEEA